MATEVAPVSTMNCTARPLMAPCVMKWPPAAGRITMLVPAALAPPPPTLAGASPTRSVCRLPFELDHGLVAEVDTTFTP
jgi:hypothetical protein